MLKISNFSITTMLLACFVVLCFCNCKSSGDDGTFFPDAPANPDKVKLVELVNEFRSTSQSCGSNNFGAAGNLTWNDTLALVAKNHSMDMNDNDKLSHTGTNGSLVNDRIAITGYELSFYAENLLKGGANEEEAIMAWIQSVAHCENLMDPDAKEIGVGTAGPYWTMVLASH